MSEVEAQILVAVIAGISGVMIAALPAYLTYRSKTESVRKEHKLAMRELDVQRVALGFDGFLAEWAEIHDELSQLIRETEIDRFLILRAWNGELSPRWTTAIFQFRDADQKPFSYVHFELDEDYIERLRYIASKAETVIEVDQLPPSAIKSVYEMEGVKHSFWTHLSSKRLSSSSVGITYCSFASHGEAPLSNTTLIRCRMLASRLRAILRDH